MVDDAQATQAITRVKSGFTSLSAPTNALSLNMGKLNQQFTAGVNPIKAQGNALTTLNTNLKATSTTSTTLGTKIKGTATQFAGFATGLAATSSGVLQLAAGFRDYHDAQIAVERQQRKLSLATEAQHKAVDKLNALTSKGIKSGKEYAQAQLDVSQANQQLSIMTQLLGERQEDMFDAQSQFVASVIPTTLGAIGTLGMAFRELGGTKGMGGLVEKFKGLGSGITTGFIPALTGIGSKAGNAIKGIVGIGTASSTAAVGVGGLKAALSGMALSLGALIGIPLGGIFAANALGNTFHEFHDAGDQIRKGQLEMAKSLGLTDAQVKTLNDSMNSINKVFGVYEPNVNKATTVTKGLIKPSQELTAAQEALNKAEKDPALKSHVTNTANAAKATLAHAQAEVDRLKAIENVIPSTISLGKGIKILADNTNTAQDAGGGFFSELSRIGVGEQKVSKNTQDLASAIASVGVSIINAKPKDLFEALAKGGPIIQTLGDETKAADPKMKSLIGTLNTGGPVMDDFLGSAKALGPGLVDAAEKAAQLKKATVDVGAAMTAGKDKFLSFIKTTGEAAITNKQYEAGLRSIVGAHVELNPNINLTTSQLEEMTKSIIEGKGAALAYADIIANQMAPAIAKFTSVIGANTMKEFNDAFKKLEFGNIDKGLSKGLKDMFKPLRDVAERSGELTNLFSALAVAGGKLSDKNIGKSIKEMAAGFKDIGKTQPLAKEFGNTLLSYIKSAPNAAAAFQKLNPVMLKFGELTADGSFSLEDFNGITELFNQTIGKTVDPVGKSAAAVKAFGVSSASARGQIDQVTGAIDVLNAQATSIKPVIVVQNAQALKAIDAIAKRIMSLTGLSPIISLVNKQAIKAVDVVAKRIDSLTGIKPQISLQNKQAIKSVDVVAKRIDSLEKIKPSISLQNKQAIKSVDVVAKRIQGLENIHPVINVKVNIPNIPNSVKGDTSTSSKGDTSGIFVGGSKSDSGGGGGDTIINVHVMDETIMRRITARSGRGRFTMGA